MAIWSARASAPPGGMNVFWSQASSAAAPCRSVSSASCSRSSPSSRRGGPAATPAPRCTTGRPARTRRRAGPPASGRSKFSSRYCSVSSRGVPLSAMLSAIRRAPSSSAGRSSAPPPARAARSSASVEALGGDGAARRRRRARLRGRRARRAACRRARRGGPARLGLERRPVEARRSPTVPCEQGEVGRDAGRAGAHAVEQAAQLGLHGVDALEHRRGGLRHALDVLARLLAGLAARPSRRSRAPPGGCGGPRGRPRARCRRRSARRPRRSGGPARRRRRPASRRAGATRASAPRPRRPASARWESTASGS